MRHSLASLGLILVLAPGCSFLRSQPPGPPTMYAHFINVGQADATLLEFPCGAILIDAGAQDDASVDTLVEYLGDFFEDRPDLNKTLESIIVTHNHIDHTRALRRIVETFTVKRYIDTGQNQGTGTGNPNWVRSVAAARNIIVRTIMDTAVAAVDSGLTGADIDPVSCQDCDPRIRILSGQLTENPGWSHSEFDNKNNHSLVLRIDFGESSFLFTGDLEEAAIDDLVSRTDSTLLDVDVYQVGHHGSHNGTTAGLLQAMGPEIAVFSVGRWDYGFQTENRFTTWHYGHPRKVVVDLISVALSKYRSDPVDVKVAVAARDFVDYTVRKRIYATAWDGTVKIRARLDESFRVTRNN